MRQQPTLDFEDLDCFFVEFGTDAELLIKETAETHEIRGIFDTPYMKRTFGSFIVDAEAPSFTCEYLPAFDDVKQGDVLTISEVEYFLQSAPETDGTGLCALILTPAYTQDAEGDPDPEADGTVDPSDSVPDDPDTDEDESMDMGDELFKP